MSDIFISYAAVDRDRIVPIVRALEAHGWSVWWDRQIPAGKSFDRVIEEALNDARCVVVVWSRHSIESNWVRAEASEGLRRNQLIPIAVDDVLPPLVFRPIQTANLSRWANDPSDDAFERFAADLSRMLREPETGPAAAGSFDKPVDETAAGSRQEAAWRTGWLKTPSIAAALILALTGFFGYRALASRPEAAPPAASPRAERGPEFVVAEIPRASAPALRWKTKNAEEVTIDGRPAELEGAMPIEPGASHTFVLIASNRHGKAARNVAWTGSERPIIDLRAEPRMLTGEDVRSFYETTGLFDQRWNPRGDLANVFEPLKIGEDAVVIDHATGLMWHPSGSMSEMANWDDANSYLKRLNERQYGGFTDWRLPTLAELASLIEPTAKNGLHIDPLFDARQKWLWTADNAGERYGNQAWGIDLEGAHANIHVHNRDMARLGFVRAVRSRAT